MNVDFGKAARDYRKHRAGFPDSFFSSLQSNGLIKGHESIIDLGTGTGTVARGLAKLGCKVIGIDPAAKLLKEANELAQEEGLQIDWREGCSENIELANESIDVVTAGQCWHWFNHQRALKEVKRVLRPSGRLIIAHFDWLPFHQNVVLHTERLIKETNPDWIFGDGVGIYPDWFRHLNDGNFVDIKSYSYDEYVSYSHEAWRGRIRASAGIKGSLVPDKVEEFDRRHNEMLKERFHGSLLSVPHRVFVVHGTRNDRPRSDTSDDCRVTPES